MKYVAEFFNDAGEYVKWLRKNKWDIISVVVLSDGHIMVTRKNSF